MPLLMDGSTPDRHQEHASSVRPTAVLWSPGSGRRC
jgi:hypothetical protein